MNVDVDRQPMGRLLTLPLGTAAGEAAAFRASLAARLRDQHTALLVELSDALHAAGLEHALDGGRHTTAERLAGGLRIAIEAWERRRRLHPAELDDLRALGGAAACDGGAPIWALLSAVQLAATTLWRAAQEHVLAALEEVRSSAPVRLLSDLALELMELAARMQTQLALGYAAPAGRSGAGSALTCAPAFSP